jgi:hypothetical protein
MRGRNQKGKEKKKHSRVPYLLDPFAFISDLPNPNWVGTDAIFEGKGANPEPFSSPL